MKSNFLFLAFLMIASIDTFSQTSGTIIFNNTGTAGLNSIGPFDNDQNLRVNGERSIYMVINEENQYPDGNFDIYLDGPSINPLFRVTSNGLVGIGIANPTYKLVVNGTISYTNGHLRNKSINTKSTSIDNIFDHKSYDLIDLGGQAGSGNEIAAIKLTTAIGQTTFGSRLIQEDNSFRIQCGSGNSNPYSFLINGLTGNVGIGTDDPKAKLSVNGTIVSEEIKVLADISTYPDFVFSDGYNLRPINEVENYIKKYKHLPGIPKAEEVAEGIALGEMNTKLLLKIEELTLYTIEQQKQLDKQMELIEKLEKTNKLLLDKLGAME
ncbi:MAG: hypothetical protein MI922_14355 [Bacteroidales bacterium]|nr:hypothetical protein [Bacteroidales bacterium]